MLNFWENGPVEPHLYIGEIYNVLIRDWEALKPPEGEFDRILEILKILWIFWEFPATTLRKRGWCFYFEWHAQRASRLAPRSESGVPENWKSVKGYEGYRDPIFLNEKKKSMSTMQNTVCKLIEGKWVNIQRFWLALKMALSSLKY